MNGFLERIREGIVIFDGAMGTMLLAEGLPVGGCVELWNLERPEEVRKVHEAYFAAGAEVVETNTFGANRLKLEAYDLGDRTLELNRRGARLARQAAPPGRWVAGSISPTGRFLEPLGDLTKGRLVEIYQEQIRGLAEGGADLLCIETMIAIEEAVAAIEAARAVCDLPVVATLAFNQDRKGFRTVMGVSPETAVRQLEAAGADAVGSNCGNGMEEMIRLMEEMRPLTSLPLVAQPNAGLPQLQEGRAIYTQSPQDFARGAPELLRAGVHGIGGCCGTTPAHIRVLVEQIKERSGR